MFHYRNQKTISKSISITGRGLHSNNQCTVTLHPTQYASGITFKHLPSGIIIPATTQYVVDCTLATTLGNQHIKLQTVEHLLSALNGLSINNVLIEVTGNELPILDGSAMVWVQAIRDVGIQQISTYIKPICITKVITLGTQKKWIRISPHSGLCIKYKINFNNSSIGNQNYKFNFNMKNYITEISSARTFCTEHDINTMRQNGLARGGSLENAVVFSTNGPLNDSLRFDNEAVRHKILDLLGDLQLIGRPIHGYIEAYCTGHAMHVELAKTILNKIDII